MAHISIGEQKLLLELLKSPGLCLTSQTVFDSKKFFVAVKVLIDNGLVEKKESRYYLTLNGEIFSLMIRGYER